MDPELEAKEKAGAAAPHAADAARVGSGPLTHSIPADQLILLEARRLVADRSTRVEDVAFCTSQDPIIVIDLLRVANAMFFSGGKAPITSAKTAVIRLGADVVLETFNKMSERPLVEDKDVAHWLEHHRVRCKRASIVATILAEALARQLSEDCQVAALFLYVGEMVAVMHLKERYAKLANESSRSQLLFRLAQDYRFDVETVGISYLRKQGIPEQILSVLDRESRPKSAERAIMKPICMAAGEMIEAFDLNRLDKLAPGKTIPPKSAIRTLQMNDQQYLKVYERIAEFLYSFKLIEEKKKSDLLRMHTGDNGTALNHDFTVGDNSLQTEIEHILDETPATPGPAPKAAGAPKAATKPPERAATKIQEMHTVINANLQDFRLNQPSAKTVARVVRAQKTPDASPEIHTQKGSAFLSSINDILEGAKTSEDLLSQVLAKLTSPGPFEKAALVVVSQDRKSAIVAACRGPSIGMGQTLKLDDPLNPLAQCLSKVQSFGNRKSSASPFGSKAFAVAPIDADHPTPVALYADCGENGALTFEARRIFRNVVTILNKKLPTLPGGIPIEIKQ